MCPPSFGVSQFVAILCSVIKEVSITDVSTVCRFLMNTELSGRAYESILSARLFYHNTQLICSVQRFIVNTCTYCFRWTLPFFLHHHVYFPKHHLRVHHIRYRQSFVHYEPHHFPQQRHPSPLHQYTRPFLIIFPHRDVH